jgi:carbon starvation protein
MHALYIVLPALCILAIAYRYYSAFIATRIWMLDDARQTPAHTKYDGSNFYPTTKWVLFGHHFAAITGAGPLVGPMLAAQFGWAPGFIWLVAGVCLAGAVHDGMVLWASTRRGGKSLADLVKIEIGPVAGFAGIFAVLFTLMVALAGLGIAVVNALADSAWGTFTIAMTIPIGMVMGMWMYVWRKGRIVEATVIGVVAMLLAVAGGEPLNHPDSTLGSFFHLSRTQIALALCVYGFIASVLPEFVHQDRHHPAARLRRDGRQPRAEDAGVHRVHRWRWTDHPRAALPLRLHHHRLRRDLGFPRADRLGHDLEDGRQGN